MSKNPCLDKFLADCSGGLSPLIHSRVGKGKNGAYSPYGFWLLSVAILSSRCKGGGEGQSEVTQPGSK